MSFYMWTDSSCSLRRPAQNSQHRFITICTLMTSLLYTSISCRWISTTLVFFTVKNCITAWGTHADAHAMCSLPCSSCYSPRLFGRSSQPKIQGCHNPKQNISPIFIAFGQLDGEGKNGKLAFRTTHVHRGNSKHSFLRLNFCYKDLINSWLGMWKLSILIDDSQDIDYR